MSISPASRLSATSAASEEGSRTTESSTSETSRRGMLWRSVAGVTLEYYDFTAFAIFAPFFAAQFFINDDPLAATMSTLAVFAAGFVARPVGAIAIAWLADTRGRKAAMITAITLTAVASLAIGLLPTYEVLGPFAAVLLTLFRIVQGIGHGGESTTAYVFVSELATPETRGRYSSIYPIALMSGVISATLLGALMTTFLPASTLTDWAWRLPFIIGGVLGLFALVLRRDLEDSEAFHKSKDIRQRITIREQISAVWTHRKGVLRVIGLTAGMTVAYYFFGVNASTYAITVEGADPSHTFWAVLCAQLLYLLVLPFWGRFSDRFGRRPNYMIAAGGLAVLTVPLSMLISSNPVQTGLAVALALVILAAATSVEPAYFSELFPTSVRATAIALPLSFGIALFGGTAPYLSTWFSSIGLSWMFAVYATALALVTLFTAYTSPEVAGRNFLHDSTESAA